MDSDEDNTREEQFSNYRSGFTIIIRGVFESEVCGDKAEDYNSAFYKQFTQLHKKMLREFPNDEHEIFIDEMRLRLNYILEATDRIDQRMAVFSFFTAAAIRFHISGRSEFIKFLIDYCIELYECEEVSVRCNICNMIGQFLKYWIQAEKKDKHEHFKMPGINENTKDVLYHILIVRHRDKMEEVRTAVYRATALIQDVTTLCSSEMAVMKLPRDILLNGVLEKDDGCRLAAVQGMEIRTNDERTIQYIASIAASDRSQTIRREAIKKLSVVPPGKINKTILQEVLVCTLTDMDKSIQEFTKDTLLSVWLVLLAQKIIKAKNDFTPEEALEKTDGKNGLPSAMITLLAALNWEEHNEEVTKIAFACLDVIRRLIAKDERMSLADVIKVISNDPIRPSVITWQRQRKLRDHRLSGSMATELFVWRCMIQYCYEKTRKKLDSNNRDNDAIRYECFKRLVLPLKDTCGTVQDIWQWKGNISKDLRENGKHFLPVDESNHNLSITEVLKICLFLERDPSGMTAWKNLLEYMLKDKTLDKNVTDHIAFSLATIHYSDPVEALRNVMERVSDMVHEEVEQKPSTSKAVIKSSPDDLMDIDDLPSDELSLYHIQVVNSVMKTGTIKEWNAYVQNIDDRLIHRCLSFLKPEARRYAVEVTGIMCLADESKAKRYFKFMFASLLNDCVEFKSLCLNTYTDWIIQFGYDKVNQWAIEFLVKDHLLDVYMDILKDPEQPEDLVFIAAECSAKIFLVSQRDPLENHWTVLLHAMMLRLFHASTLRFPKLRSCLIQFSYIFASGSRSNQMIIATAIVGILQCPEEGSDDIFFRKVNTHHAVSSMMFWCTEQVLTSEALEISTETKVHAFIFIQILNYLAEFHDNLHNRIKYSNENIIRHTNCLDWLDVSNIPEDKLDYVQLKLSQAYNTLKNTGVMGSRHAENMCTRNLVRIQKKLNNHFNLQNEEELYQMEMGQSRGIKRIPTGMSRNGKKQPPAVKKPRLQSPEQPPESPVSVKSHHSPSASPSTRNPPKKIRQMLFF